MKSTLIVALSTMTSRILGFVREALFAAFFGATGITDAFFIAFRIPNLFRRLVTEGALSVSFIPVYTETRIKRGEGEALELAQKTFTLLLSATAAIVLAGVVFSPEIAGLLGWGIDDPFVLGTAARLNRMLFPFLLSAVFVAFSMGVLNSHGFFFAPSFATVLLNAGIISGILVSVSFMDEPIYGVAAGLLGGAVLQCLIQVPYLAKSGFRMKFSLDTAHPGVRKIFSLALPSLLGIAVYQVNILVSTVMASRLARGSISYLYYSDRLTELVLGVFIMSIGNVILPEMSRLSASSEIGRIRSLYASSIRASLFLAVPAMAALAAVGYPVISVLFMRGSFGPEDARMTYRALVFSCLGLAPIAVLRIAAPTFYSLSDTRSPAIAAAVSFIVNIAAGWLLMGTSLKHGGLALANSISVTVQMVLLQLWLRKKIGAIGSKDILLPLAKYAAAAALMACSTALIASFFDWTSGSFCSRALGLFLIVSAGMLVYFLACLAMGTGEVDYLLGKVKNKWRIDRGGDLTGRGKRL